MSRLTGLISHPVGRGAEPDERCAASSGSSLIAGSGLVGGGLVEEVAVPAGGGEGDGAGFVLEHPAGEVAARPLAGGEDTDHTASARLVAEHPTEQCRHLVIGQQVV